MVNGESSINVVYLRKFKLSFKLSYKGAHSYQ
jgi:hypothetical protein